MLSETILHQYNLLRQGVGLLRRTDRGLIEAVGPDRAAWLHNLVTNVIKTLGAGDGNYAFAVNIKGRVVFDLNMLVLDNPAQPDGRLWLDIDAGWTADALKHLNRYIITENVALADRSAHFARLALIGPRAAGVVERLGLGNLRAMASLQHVEVGSVDPAARMLRHDFCGVMAAEFVVPLSEEAAWQARLLDAGRDDGIQPVDVAAVDIVRIESGIPASRRDIDAEVVPPETGQIERGISYHKGCYLGQEVIERMRSHGVLPRKLVGLRLHCAEPPAPPLTLRREANEIGRVTSTCWSPLLNVVLALGYMKSAHIAAGVRLTAAVVDGVAIEAELAPFNLPVAQPR